MAQGPAIPSFILRGHLAPIHALQFFASNLYLASGDGDGWIVVWSLATKRAVGVWKGHEGGIMGLRDWTTDRLVSHGRDHQLRVWQLRPCDYTDLDVRLPADGAAKSESKWPWLLFSLAANALNYCAFGMCDEKQACDTTHQDITHRSQLIANPNGLDAGGIDIFQLPSGQRVCRLPSDKNIQTGMVMAVSLSRPTAMNDLILISGYESGHIFVHKGTRINLSEWRWQKLLHSQAHTQPILAISSAADGGYFLTSSADATIAKFQIPHDKVLQAKPQRSINTKHAGQQDIKLRDDGKIFSTAGWDKRVRIYSARTMKELAVLKWHQEGCYAVAFASVSTETCLQKDMLESQEGDKALMQSTLDILKKQRDDRAQNTHWLAAGGKDGKISLWDIY